MWQFDFRGPGLRSSETIVLQTISPPHRGPHRAPPSAFSIVATSADRPSGTTGAMSSLGACDYNTPAICFRTAAGASYDFCRGWRMRSTNSRAATAGRNTISLLPYQASRARMKSLVGVRTAQAARRFPDGKHSQSEPNTMPIRMAAAGQTSDGDANTKPPRARMPQVTVTKPTRLRRSSK